MCVTSVSPQRLRLFEINSGIPFRSSFEGVFMTLCIVVFDDENGLCVPMTTDAECEGAIEAGSGPVIVFANRDAARKAIKISKAKAELLKAQGKTANEDFLESIKCIKIRQVTSWIVSGQ